MLPLIRNISCIAMMAVVASSALAVDLVWTDSTTGQILRGTAGSGGMAQVLFDNDDYPMAPSTVAPFGIAVDDTYLYWSDVATGQILRGASDGSGSATVLFDGGDYPGLPSTIGPAGLAVDDSFVYWADNATGEILRGLKDGTGTVSSLFTISDYPESPSDIYPWDVAVDGGTIFWSDSDTSQILRGAASGTGSAQVVFSSDIERVNLGLALDGGFVYWGDTDNEFLQGNVLRGSADGSGLPALLYEPADYPGSPSSIVPIGIAASQGVLYWVDSLTNQVLSGPASGTGPVSLMFDISSYPGGPSSIGPSFLVVIEADSDGDFDGDGDVDGRDFLVWQRGQSPNPLSGSDLELWQQQYGTVSSLATLQSVPEPSGMLLMTMLAVWVGGMRRAGPGRVSLK